MPRNATAEAIKKAKRKKAMATHPDRGGDKAAFELVLWAADVLLDPARRKRYDETGEAGERNGQQQPSAEDQVTVLLASVYHQSMAALSASDVDPTQVDLVGMMRGELERQLREVESREAGARNGVKMLGKVLGRFRKKKGRTDAAAANLFERLTRQRLEETERALAGIAGPLAAIKAALDQLCRIEFEHEMPDFGAGVKVQMSSGLHFGGTGPWKKW